MSNRAPSTRKAKTNGGVSRRKSAKHDASVETIEAAAGELREAGRRSLGVTGDGEVTSLRQSLAESGVGMYPALALGGLVAVDQLQTTGLTILGPEITNALGIARPTYAFVLLLKTLMVTMCGLGFAAAVQRHPRRASISIWTAFAWAAFTLMTGFVVSSWGLIALAVVTGAATASVRALHQPLLLDIYPPQTRVRISSLYRGFENLGNIAGPLVIALCAVVLSLTWRGVFLALGVVAVGAAVYSLRLEDPGFGRWDTDRVRELVSSRTNDGNLDETDAQLGFFEITRRLLLIPTIRRLLAAWAVLGMLLTPFLTYLAFFLQERWEMDAGARAMFSAVTPVFGIVALRLFGRRGEEMFREDPARLLRFSGVLMGAGVVAIALGLFSPVFVLMGILFGTGLAIITVVGPAIALPMYAIVPANMRAHLGALQGIFLAGVGGFGGLVLLGGVDRRFGAAGAILSLAVPGVLAGLVIRSAASTINDDVNRMVDNIVEEEQIRTLASQGTKLPLLACRNINFSYGQLQVLFDVNFTVDDGEMVALLGTNGAGKSTLLRVISGLGLPSTGSVRFRGVDVTYVSAERRVGHGISQIPGGRAVFRPMSVVENLRLSAYSHGADRREAEAGIEATFDAFPVLAERRNQPASTLSGGEQQMLGLGKAFILKPKLLLIDELSLGLAPIIVGELLDVVRKLNAMGTAVVLVEQSVNIALSLVDHAYFMEKGEIRFDGRSKDLMGRSDLLRSVFLEGATKGTTPATKNGRRPAKKR